MKRLSGLILIISLLFGACQTTDEADIIVPPLAIAVETAELISTPVETSLEQFVLYPPVVVDRYPADGVRGIYLSAHGAVSPGISANADALLASTNLNAVVIDYKDDYGHMMSQHTSNDAFLQSATSEVYSASELINKYRANGVYTIARIVCFKDSFRAKALPELALKNANGSAWSAPSGDAYLNPFAKENWDYLVEASIEAAKAGFDEIQFDYVRFPENFNYLSTILSFDRGDYAALDMSEEAKRSQVIADFIGYAREKLKPYNVRLSADIFGYVTMVQDDGNIGQNFLLIAHNVDAISSMIYPSHWSDGSFGAAKPDTQPGVVVAGYIAREKELLATLETPAISRPWLQSFTASYLGPGNFVVYGKEQLEAQINALKNAGVQEYLLWDPANNYLPGVNY